MQSHRAKMLWLTTWRCGPSERISLQGSLKPCWKEAYWLLLMNPWVSTLKSTNLWISVFHLRRLPHLHPWWSTPVYRRLQIKVIQSRQRLTKSRWHSEQKAFPKMQDQASKVNPAMYNSHVYFIVAVSFISQVFSSILNFSSQAGHLPYILGL